ncbi:MAG: DUF5333 domain-containing protein [Rhodobacteraceae bacterium]|nr:DUF5333 domain-containing protein [Paracoccaceae bacterium]
MRKTKKIVIGAVSATILATSMSGASSAADYQILRDDNRVHTELLAASLAYLINEACPSIKIRRLKVTGQALSLRSYAKSLGYSGGEVDAYVSDHDEQERFRAIAEAALAEKGVVEGDAASYCTVGRAEIKAGSFAGGMLRGG